MTGQQGESSQQTMLETDHPTSSSNIDTKEISYAKKLHNEKPMIQYLHWIRVVL